MSGWISIYNIHFEKLYLTAMLSGIHNWLCLCCCYGRSLFLCFFYIYFLMIFFYLTSCCLSLMTRRSPCPSQRWNDPTDSRWTLSTGKLTLLIEPLFGSPLMSVVMELKCIIELHLHDKHTGYMHVKCVCCPFGLSAMVPDFKRSSIIKGFTESSTWASSICVTSLENGKCYSQAHLACSEPQLTAWNLWPQLWPRDVHSCPDSLSLTAHSYQHSVCVQGTDLISPHAQSQNLINIFTVLAHKNLTLVVFIRCI